LSQADLTELCRQLRLAHVVDYVTQQEDKHVQELVEKLLVAEREGRRRSKLGKLVQQAGFPHLKTFDGYLQEHM
jgi:hypothetical protein